MTTRANIYVDQGVDFKTVIEFYSDNDQEVNLESAVFVGKAAKLYSNVQKLDIYAAIILGDPVNDVEITVRGEDSALCVPGKYVYDILMVGSNGSIEKILEGLLFVVPTISNIL